MAWSTALLCLALGAAPSGGGVRPAEVELEAEWLLHEDGAGRSTADGRAALSTSGAAVDAERIHFDRRSQTVAAFGGVVARIAQDGLVAVYAEVVILRLEDGRVRSVAFLEGRAETKDGVRPELFLAARTREAVRALGRTTALVAGNLLERDGDAWTARSVQLVPCECDFEHPSWHVSASSARLPLARERASLWNPAVWIGPVPVFYSPWLSLPLSNRQSGLLFPKPGVNPLKGLSYQQPIFVTLGESADVTVTPGYFGGPAVDPKLGRARDFGVAGPRVALEFLYAPARDTSGRLSLATLYDLRDARDVIRPDVTVPGVRRGLRWEAAWVHSQELGAGWSLRANANAISDGYLLRDVTTDLLQRESGYLRSTAHLSSRTAHRYLGLDVGLRQDVRWGHPILGAPLVVPGAAAARLEQGPSPLHRLPVLTLALPLRRVWGPLAAGLEASFARVAPLLSGSGDEGTGAAEGRLMDATSPFPAPWGCGQERLYWPSALNPLSDETCRSALAGLPGGKSGQGDRVFQPGEREGRLRLHVAPRLVAAFTPGGWLGLSATAAWRQTAWLGELTGRAGQRGYPILGVRADTTGTRSFRRAALRHAITPWAELRSIPFVLGQTPAPYDELDVAIPDRWMGTQAVVGLSQRLLDGRGEELARLDVAQALSLAGSAPRGGARLGETMARMGFRLGWLDLQLLGRVDASPSAGGPRATQLAGRLGVDDGRGHGLAVEFLELADEYVGWSRGHADLLTDRPPWQGELTRSQRLTVELRWLQAPLRLGYAARAQTSRWALPDGAVAMPLALAQHELTATFLPACDCFEIGAFVRTSPRLPAGTGASRTGWAVFSEVPDIGLVVNVSRFGSIGVSR